MHRVRLQHGLRWKSARRRVPVHLWSYLLRAMRTAQPGLGKLSINGIDNNPVSGLGYFYLDRFRTRSYQTVGVRFQVDKISVRDDVFGKLARSCGHGKYLLGSK